MNKFYRNGSSFIYPVLNWRFPFNAALTIFGVLFLSIAVHMFLFWIYNIRISIKKRYWKVEELKPRSYILLTQTVILLGVTFLLNILKKYI